MARSPGTKRRKRPANQPVTREEVLSAAAALFSKHGYEGATMRAIAQELGIQAPSLYHHFPAKDDLLFAYLDEALDSFVTACRAARDGAGDDPTRQLAAVVKANALWQIGRLGETPFINLNLYGAMRRSGDLSEARRRKLGRKQDEFVAMLREILERGRALGRFEYRDAAVAAYAIIGTVDHVVYWFRSGGRLSPEEVAEAFAELALRSVGAAPARRRASVDRAVPN